MLLFTIIIIILDNIKICNNVNRIINYNIINMYNNIVNITINIKIHNVSSNMNNNMMLNMILNILIINIKNEYYYY